MPWFTECNVTLTVLPTIRIDFNMNVVCKHPFECRDVNMLFYGKTIISMLKFQVQGRVAHCNKWIKIEVIISDIVHCIQTQEPYFFPFNSIFPILNSTPTPRRIFLTSGNFTASLSFISFPLCIFFPLKIHTILTLKKYLEILHVLGGNLESHESYC